MLKDFTLASANVGGFEKAFTAVAEEARGVLENLNDSFARS